MTDLGRGLVTVAASVLFACATTSSSVSDEARLDETGGKEAALGKKARACGPDGVGDVVLLDARTGGPVTCQAVTLTREPMACAEGAECPSDVVFKGLSGPQGLVKLTGPVDKQRLLAAADGYGPSSLPNATVKPGALVELELAPADGFWLKVLDREGNFLPDVSISFRQGQDVIAQLRTNSLANVFFTQRQPFAGQPVDVVAEGFEPVIISSAADLGEDGHTLTLSR
ncbi:MAG: hypothetical protein AMXMBFR34_45170 [Myxococcaceae bacterium]